MKRFIAIIAIISIFACPMAFAVDVHFMGEFNLHTGYANNPLFQKDDNSAGGAFATQRFGLGTHFALNEKISGLVYTLIGPFHLGDASYGFNHEMAPADYGGIGVMFAFIDWRPMENLSFTAGLQRIEMPSATFGSPVFAARSGGLNTMWSINDNLGLNVILAQPLYDPEDPNGLPVTSDNKEYIIAASLDIKKAGLTPWLIYGNTGNNAYHAISPDYGRGGHTEAYVGGVAVKFDRVDRLYVGLDAMYGMAESNAEGNNPFETAGFVAALKMDYTLEFGKIGLYGWYGSGSDREDAANNKFGVMPVLGGDGNFAATTFGFPGSFNFSMYDSLIGFSPIGMWAVGASIDEVSFINKLTHKLAATYIVGTNEKGTPNTYIYYGGPGIPFLTTEDSLVELNFVTKYQVMEGLTFAVELAYFLTDFATAPDGRGESDDAFVGQFGVKYAF